MCNENNMRHEKFKTHSIVKVEDGQTRRLFFY